MNAITIRVQFEGETSITLGPDNDNPRYQLIEDALDEHHNGEHSETLAAAIKKLEKTREHYVNQYMYLHGNDEYGYLWRIIDPQLAILRHAQGMVRPGVGVTVVNDALDLARAILGGA